MLNSFIKILTIIIGAAFLLIPIFTMVLRFYIKLFIEAIKIINGTESLKVKMCNLMKIVDYYYSNLLFKLLKERLKKFQVNKENSIVEEVLYKKKKQYYNALCAIVFSANVYCYGDIFFHINAKTEILLFLYVIMGFIIVSGLLVSYRIKKGYYGTNYEEGKELLFYLIKNSDKNNKDSGKKIFNKPADNKENVNLPAMEGELQY